MALAEVTRAVLAVLGFVAVLSATDATAGTAPPADSTRLHNIAKLAELWGEIRYKHPSIAYKNIDWDSALVVTLPKIEAVSDTAEYARAVEGMLAFLGDPATHVYHPPPRLPPAEDAPPFSAWNGKVLVLTLGATTRPGFSAERELRALAAEVSKASGVVVDFRMRRSAGGWYPALEASTKRIVSLLFAGELQVPGSRAVQYLGYPPQGGTTSGGYEFGFKTVAGKTLTGTPGPRPRRAVFLFDSYSPIPPELLALRQKGIALFVTEGEITDASVVETTLLDAGGGVTVETRLEEVDLPFASDARLPAREASAAAGAKDLALEKGLELALSKGSRRAPGSAPVPPPAVWRPDRTYSETPYPDRAHRQLAAIRQWNVIRLFYPYLGLLDLAWDGALLERHLGQFETAQDARAYAAAALQMAAEIEDTHTRVFGGKTDELLGGGRVTPAFEALEIEGKPVVVRVGKAAAAAGVKAGDVIEAVDGEPMADRMARLKPYITASTPGAFRGRLIATALQGADSSSVTLRLNGGGGSREVKLARRSSDVMEMHTTPEPFKILSGNIGYALMDRLQPSEVDSMFRMFADTRGIIFDMRGYPNGTAWPIAPHINTRHAKIGAVFERAIVTGSGPQRLKFEQELPRMDVPLYRGRTVMLIDERAISQSEHTCLFFEAANGTTFVGSPTSGANGDVTRYSLPGGLSGTFTGHDVRHADGRQLQRVGIKPDVPVRPTIAGLRAGRDEVLERGIAVIGGEAR